MVHVLCLYRFCVYVYTLHHTVYLEHLISSNIFDSIAQILKPEFRKCWDIFLHLNKMKTKRLSNHMSPYFIHNIT